MIGFPFYQESRELKIDAQIWDLIRWDEEDQIWTLYMMEMWTNFAKFGYVHYFKEQKLHLWPSVINVKKFGFSKNVNILRK